MALQPYKTGWTGAGAAPGASAGSSLPTRETAPRAVLFIEQRPLGRAGGRTDSSPGSLLGAQVYMTCVNISRLTVGNYEVIVIFGGESTVKVPSFPLSRPLLGYPGPLVKPGGRVRQEVVLNLSPTPI